MGITLLILLLLVTGAALFIGPAIYNRKRGQPTRREVPKATQPTLIAERRVPTQEPQPIVVERAEATLFEETSLAEEVQARVIQEAQLPATVETQPTAAEKTGVILFEETPLRRVEIQPRPIQESQPPVTSERQPTKVVAEEAQPLTEGETQQIAAEQGQLMVPEATQPVSGGKRPKPIKRGGRPRDPTAGHKKQPSGKLKTRGPRPEIVCWKRDRQWVVAVEVPKELSEKPGLAVVQDSISLPQDEQDESENTCWRLKEVFGKVIVRWNEAGAVREAKVDLGQDNYLLFRLVGENLNRGRRVKSPGAGSYLVIAPNEWKRYEALSGPPPTAPEPVCLKEYQAHFFDLAKGDEEKIAFQLPGGRPLVIESEARRFELVGNRIEDASEHMGPLFGEGPPRIRALDAQAWQGVGTIVIGEEGRGRERWRTEFSPDPCQGEQDLPSELLAQKSGWYFLRFYDANDDLIESLDFRFIVSLKQITLRESRPLPSEDGHRPVYVEFLHEPDCSVRPVENLANIQIDRKHDKTVITVPRDPTCDQSHWEVHLQDGPAVEVVILVERIWWAVGEEHTTPSDWQDRPVVLAREDFKATSSKALWLRLPKRRWVDKVLVGFERSKGRPYNVKVTEKTVAIPLRDYGDCPEVEDQTQEYNLKIWVKDTEGILAVLPISQVRVAPVPLQAMPSLRIESWSGIGRKKTAIAKAVMRKGSGEINVNGQLVDDYFGQAPRQAKQFLERLRNLEKVRKVLSQMEVDVTVQGSSPTTMRQAKAVAHAIARTLMSYDHDLTPVLKQGGFGGTKVRASKAKGGKL